MPWHGCEMHLSSPRKAGNWASRLMTSASACWAAAAPQGPPLCWVAGRAWHLRPVAGAMVAVHVVPGLVEAQRTEGGAGGGSTNANQPSRLEARHHKHSLQHLCNCEAGPQIHLDLDRFLFPVNMCGLLPAHCNMPNPLPRAGPLPAAHRQPFVQAQKPLWPLGPCSRARFND